MAAPCDFSTFGDLSLICGNSEHYIDDSVSFSLFECDKDTSYHLRSLNSSERIDIPESLLILYRTGLFCFDEHSLQLKICQKHRDFYGIYWKRSKVKCGFPEHPPSSKAKADRGASPSLCKGNWYRTREAIPVGTGLCKSCSTQLRNSLMSSNFGISMEDDIATIKKLQEKMIQEKDSGRIDSDEMVNNNNNYNQPYIDSENVNMEVEDCVTDSQPSSTQASCSLPSSQFNYLMPSSEEDWFESHLSPKERWNAGLKILSNNSYLPLRSQLLSPIDELQKSAKYYYVSKAKEAVMIMLGLIAPGQEDVLLKEICKNQIEKEEFHQVDDITKQLIEAYYKSSDKKTQTQILSLFVKKFTKQRLLTLMPSLTCAKIDFARKHASLVGPGQMINPPKIFRIRLTKPKLLHFLEYVSSPSVSQVLGFGSTELKLSSGEKIQMP